MDIKNDIIKAVELFVIEANNLFMEDFVTPSIRFDLHGLTAGLAFTSQWMLRFNAELLDAEGFEAMYDTVGHEVAHLFADKVQGQNCGHGKHWQHIMAAFGLKTSRCHAFKSAKRIRSGIRRIWFYRCDCDATHIVSTRKHNLIRVGRIYICTECKAPIQYKCAGVRFVA